MTHLEDRISHALRSSPTRPSSDLFERVVDSIEADRRRRRTTLAVTAGALATLGTVTAAVLTLTPRTPDGDLAMPWWILELGTIAVLLALAFWLGPFIKRFGRAYAADVFHDNPMTGKSYIVLTDIVYYLIFAAYILFSTQVAPMEDWAETVTPAQVTYEMGRVGGILLVIGVLHGLNIVLMPVLGRLFSLNRSLSGAPRRDRHAEPVDLDR
jgi:hypothetical protein